MEARLCSHWRALQQAVLAYSDQCTLVGTRVVKYVFVLNGGFVNLIFKFAWLTTLVTLCIQISSFMIFSRYVLWNTRYFFPKCFPEESDVHRAAHTSKHNLKVGCDLSAVSTVDLQSPWCGKKKPADLFPQHLLLVMVWFSFPHIERIKSCTYFPTSPSNYHFPQKYHTVEQCIVPWPKTDVYHKPASFPLCCVSACAVQSHYILTNSFGFLNNFLRLDELKIHCNPVNSADSSIGTEAFFWTSEDDGNFIFKQLQNPWETKEIWKNQCFPFFILYGL